MTVAAAEPPGRPADRVPLPGGRDVDRAVVAGRRLRRRHRGLDPATGEPRD